MEQRAFYNLSYGVFVLGAKSGDRINACITNTCFQAAVNPVRIAISVINQNLTCEMIRESGFFSLSVLDKTCDFETIKRFGYQSGRTTDKFNAIKYDKDKNGCPYIMEHVCAVFECRVVSMQNLGSHSIFIAEVTDARLAGSGKPLTYADYQADVKPKKTVADLEKVEKKIIGWRCKICGYEYEGAELPADFECPVCGHPAEDFEPIFES